MKKTGSNLTVAVSATALAAGAALFVFSGGQGHIAPDYISTAAQATLEDTGTDNPFRETLGATAGYHESGSNEAAASRVTYLLTLNSARLRLRAPIPVNVDVFPGYAIAYIPDLDQFAVGTDEPAALDELRQVLGDTFDVLRDHANNLGPLPQKQWGILSSFIELNTA